MLRTRMLAGFLALALAGLPVIPAAVGQSPPQPPALATASPVPGSAVSPGPARPVVTADVAALTATTSGQAGRVQVTLHNPTEEPVRLRVSPVFRQARSAEPVLATWTRLPDGTSVDSGQEQLLRKGETATFQAEASLPAPGSYETFLQVDGSATTPPRRHPLTVVRTAADLPVDFLLDPRPARVTLGLTGGGGSAGSIRFVGRNASAEPVELGGARAGRFVTLDGDAETSVATVTPASVTNGDCKGVIASKTDCAFDIALPAGLGPGRYTLDLMVDGRFGGQSLRALKVELRASPWLAGGVVALGALVGVLISVWRTEGRPLLRQLVAAGDARIFVTRILATAASRAAAEAARGLVGEIRNLEGRIRKGGEHEAEIALVSKQATALAAAEAATRSVRAAGPDAAVLLRPLTERLDTLLLGRGWNAVEVEAAAQRIGDELSGLSGLAAAAKSAAELRDRLAPLRGWVLADSAIQEAWRGLEAVLKGSREPVPVPPAAVEASKPAETAQRAAALAGATAALAGLEPVIARQSVTALRAALDQPPTDAARALKARVDAAGPAPPIAAAREFAAEAGRIGIGGRATEGGVASAPTLSILPSDSALRIDLDAASWLGLTGSETPDRLRGKALVWEFLTNALVLAMIAMLGVLALWVGNPAWGSVQDFLTAFFGGVGTRLAIGPIPAPGR